MKKITTLGVAALAAGALTTTAIAQTAPVTVTAKGSPTKAGTKKKPANTTTSVDFTVDPSINATLGTITYEFPKTVKISGAGFPTCTLEDLADKGESGCPKKSKVGSGTSEAALGTTPLNFTFNIYVSGPKSIALALTGPVSSVFEGAISGNKVVVTIPDGIQKPAPNAFSYIREINSKLGTKAITKGKGKKKKTYRFVSTTGCKGGKQKIGVSLALTPNGQTTPASPLTGSTSINCKK